jgi:hypothetical protein
LSYAIVIDATSDSSEHQDTARTYMSVLKLILAGDCGTDIISMTI